MNKPIKIDRTIHFQRRGRGARKAVREGVPAAKPPLPGRVPRVARFMALAIRFDQLIQSCDVADYAELARLSHVSRARITQIMNLLMLAPDVQEAILFLPRVESGYDPIHIRQLQQIALVPDWRKQRGMWAEAAINKHVLALAITASEDRCCASLPIDAGRGQSRGHPRKHPADPPGQG